MITIPIDEKIVQSLRQVVTDTKSNLHAVMLSVFAILIGKYTGKNNINFGTTLANRDNLNYVNLVGDFASVVILPVEVQRNSTVLANIEYVRDLLFEGMDHANVILSDLIENTEFQRLDNVNPLYQMIFSVHNKKLLSGIEEGENKISEGVEISVENIERANNNDFNLDIAIIALDKGDGIDLQVEYSTKFFSEERIRCIVIVVQVYCSC